LASIAKSACGSGRPSSGRERALERLLWQQEAELLARKRSFRDDLPANVSEPRDDMEHSVDNLARAVGATVLELSSSTVRGIAGALRRMRSGRYGTCTDCGRRIPAARLKVLPFAERCLECQSQSDLQAREAAPESGAGLFSNSPP
jgi:DnaK suppressor protein